MLVSLVTGIIVALDQNHAMTNNVTTPRQLHLQIDLDIVIPNLQSNPIGDPMTGSKLIPVLSKERIH